MSEYKRKIFTVDIKEAYDPDGNKYKDLVEQLQVENLMLREIVEGVLVLHVEGREFMTSSQLYEAVIQDCTKALNSTREE